MLLRHLCDRNALVVLGLNSGTSADSIDCATVKILRSPRGSIRVSMLEYREYPLGEETRHRISECSRDNGSLDMASALSRELGTLFGRTARREIDRMRRKGVRMDLVATHGQTVRHIPWGVRSGDETWKVTTQLGTLEDIAQITGLVTVGDFRQADIAAGGEGAPITAGAMSRLFTSPRESRVIVNIGGIANYFYLPKLRARSKLRMADTGPGNGLSDLLMRHLYNKPMDSGGKVALSGNVSHRLLTLILAHPFFSGKQISTGKEQFGPEMVLKMLSFARKFRVPDADLLATAVAATTSGIVRGVKPILNRDRSVNAVYVMGGGRKNRAIMRMLAEQLPAHKIQEVDKLGIDGGAVEAASYALLGEAAIRSESLIPSTGAKSMRTVLGRIVQPPLQSRNRKL